MSMELNKIAAAILLGGVVALGSGFLADLLVQPNTLEEPVYTVEMPEEDEGDGGTQTASAEGTGDQATGGGDGGGQAAGGGDGQGFAALLAKASPSDGEKAVTACKACHSFNKGGPNKVGPKLYDVVGRKIASVDGFSYSDALKSKEGAWTYEKLSAYLEAPKEWAPGNNMSYPGVQDDAKRADIIAYLRQQSDNPPALPEAGGPDGQAASGDGETAEGDQQAAAEGDGETETAKATQATDGGAAGAAGGGNGLSQKVASADPSAGAGAVGVCKACHSFNKGGPNKVGPNVYAVVGKDIASHEGFRYSDALKGKDGEWTLTKLDKYLENPNGWAPGNRMTYPGVKDDQTRHNILAYLLQQSKEAGGVE